jgi:hypothetical protein
MNKRPPSKAEKAHKGKSANRSEASSQGPPLVKNLPRGGESAAVDRIKGGGVKDHSILGARR